MLVLTSTRIRIAVHIYTKLESVFGHEEKIGSDQCLPVFGTSCQYISLYNRKARHKVQVHL